MRCSSCHFHTGEDDAHTPPSWTARKAFFPDLHHSAELAPTCLGLTRRSSVASAFPSERIRHSWTVVKQIARWNRMDHCVLVFFRAMFRRLCSRVPFVPPKRKAGALELLPVHNRKRSKKENKGRERRMISCICMFFFFLNNVQMQSSHLVEAAEGRRHFNKDAGVNFIKICVLCWSKKTNAVEVSPAVLENAFLQLSILAQEGDSRRNAEQPRLGASRCCSKAGKRNRSCPPPFHVSRLRPLILSSVNLVFREKYPLAILVAVFTVPGFLPVWRPPPPQLPVAPSVLPDSLKV